MVKVIAIPPSLLDEFWPKVEGFIQSALSMAGGEMLIEDVYNYIQDDKYILLVVMDKEPIAAVTLELIDYPRMRKVGIVHVGGKDIKRWFSSAWSITKRLAKEYGAEKITWTGRTGWERFMKNEGSKGYFVGEVTL